MFLDLPYGVPFKFRAPMVKAGVRDFAVSADWTPATGDVKISKDGGAIANIGTLPAVVASSAAWEFTLAAAEMQAREIFVQVIDSATKEVDDQSFILRTRPTLSSGQLSTQTGAAAGEVYIPDAAITANDQYIGARYYEWNSSGVLVGYGVITDSVEDTQDKLVLNGGAALWWTPASGNYFTIEPFGVSGVTEAQLAAAVLNATASSYNTAGTIGEKINDAGSAGDPWATALPGAYGAGTAGKIVGDNLNAAVGSRSSQTSVDDLPTNAELATALGNLNDLDAAGVRAAVGLAAANLDTQLSGIAAFVDTEVATILSRLGVPVGASFSADIAAVKAVVDGILADTGTDGVVVNAAGLATDAVNEIRDAIFARAFSAGYNSLTFDQFMKIIIVALVAKVSGMDANSPAFRNLADNADVITGTTDANGNRTAVTLNP